MDAVGSGDRSALARAITLIESNVPEHKTLADEILTLCSPSAGDSVRLGFSGIPGAGKSTLIDRLGTQLVRSGRRVAVLAIDPSSAQSGGSILGDKTRMETLSREGSAFIRPSPSRGALGGVGSHTWETIALCEAAGFDTILVETVGVGQSETDVAHLTDFVFLLVVTGAGDELQGMKRGVIEYADAIVVTKADGDNRDAAEAAVNTYRSVASLIQSHEGGRAPRVVAVSAHEDRGIDELWPLVDEFKDRAEADGRWNTRRLRQREHWFRAAMLAEIKLWVSEKSGEAGTFADLERRVRDGELSPRSAVQALRSHLRAG